MDSSPLARAFSAVPHHERRLPSVGSPHSDLTAFTLSVGELKREVREAVQEALETTSLRSVCDDVKRLVSDGRRRPAPVDHAAPHGLLPGAPPGFVSEPGAADAPPAVAKSPILRSSSASKMFEDLNDIGSSDPPTPRSPALSWRKAFSDGEASKGNPRNQERGSVRPINPQISVDTGSDVDSDATPAALPPVRIDRRITTATSVSAPLASLQNWRTARSRAWALEEIPDLVRAFVKSPRFDYFACIAVLLNAVSIGVQTDYMATHGGDQEPSALRYIETVFAAIFTGEVMLRIYTFRGRFFTMPGREWNLLDLAVVGLQISEELISLAMVSSSTSTSSFSVVRLVRILRLIRVVRLVRVLRAISDLRTLVLSIISSMKSLAWTVVLLFLLIYSLSLFITQFVTDHRKLTVEDQRTAEFPNLVLRYGSLPLTMLSLFQAITGGVDWESLSKPLMDEVSVTFALLISAYIGFCSLALLNVVTGVFVDSVLKSAKSDKDHFLINNVRELFSKLEDGLQSSMKWDEFQDHINTTQMQDFLEAIDLDHTDAKGLFVLLDADNSGTVSAEEFLNGLLRLRGPAKALDMAVLMREVSRLTHRVWHMSEHVGVQHTGVTAIRERS